MNITEIHQAYAENTHTPQQVVETSQRKIRDGDPAIWISTVEEPSLAHLTSPEVQPLYGIPFAIKDNIDLSGVPTTAGCPDYAYEPTVHARVVEQLIEAGAVPMGKTNLDQFATGLVGVRSPYGVPGNAINPEYIPGGSSSGSAVAVANGQVAFSLGTDTAGSGRVPAAYQNLIGLKPTRGLFSTTGVVPACRSLDCVSVFAHTAADARKVFDVVAGFDASDAWSRKPESQLHPSGPVYFGVPREDQLNFFGNEEYEALFARCVENLEARGWVKVEIDFEPFLETARLLYEGPWVSERTTAIEVFLQEKPEALHPVTRGIISGGFTPSAVEMFKATYRLQELRRKVEPVWNEIQLLLTPTCGTHYTIAEVEADPVQTNSNLGTYTNFMNLLDLCAIAVPAGTTMEGMPFGVTFAAPAFHDHWLLDRAEEWTTGRIPPQVDSGRMQFAVCGAHLKGLPLNGQIIERGGRFVRSSRSAPCYRMIAIPGAIQKPGMLKQAEGGTSIELEIWDLPLHQVGSFLSLIPPPLGLGSVMLEDGSWMKGFVCEGSATDEADVEDITHYGSWRAWLARDEGV